MKRAVLWNDRDAAMATGGQATGSWQASGVAFDSRQVVPGDLFVALGEPLGKEGAWSVRIYHKPFIRWIWLGGLIMSLGGFLAAIDRRYFRLRKRAQVSTAEATVGTV